LSETWSQKQRYAYFKILSGLKRASISEKRARHLVLTTSADPTVKGNSKQLYDDAKEFAKRVRRLTPLKLILAGFILSNEANKYYPSKPLEERLYFQYHRVRTNEGNGVLHYVVVSDFIPYHWITKTWDEIHKSPNVSIIEISPDNYGDRARYIVTQYVASQGTSYVRSSMTKNFIFPKWASTYQKIKESVYRHRADYSQQHFNAKLGRWLPRYKTKHEVVTESVQIPKSQVRLFPVVFPTDKQLIRERWDACIEQNVNC
jgi:hypothetical protein